MPDAETRILLDRAKIADDKKRPERGVALIVELPVGGYQGRTIRYEFARARATGEEPDLGQNRKATVGMS